MDVLIYGCSRLTDALAPVLVQDGHQVTVLDTDASRLAILEKQTSVSTLWIAEPLMQDFLTEGKIGTSDAFFSLSEDDHRNVLLCQIATEIYNIGRAMCHLSDPQLQDFYEPLGMRVLHGGHDFLGSARDFLEQ